MDKILTSLSVGLIVAALLQESPDVAAKTETIFPVIAETDAVLPYIFFRRIGFDPDAVKNPCLPADTVMMEVSCCAEGYEESVALAEAVRKALDMKQAHIPGLRMRSCALTGADEQWADDAYIQRLIFTIKA